MNERIKIIGRQAGFAFIEDGIYGQRWYSSKCGMDASEFEKFAELIVRDCAEQAGDCYCGNDVKSSILNRFGVIEAMNEHCKGCKHHHNAGHPKESNLANTYNNWCVKFSRCANKAVGECKLKDGKST
jgi:hypothetical protein